MGNIRIGEYIHWKYYNYLNYGLNKSSDSLNKTNPAQALANQINIVKQEIRDKIQLSNKQKIKTQLEARLNFFYSTKQVKIGNKEYSPEDIKKLKEKLQKAIEQKMSNSSLDLDYLTAQDTSKRFGYLQRGERFRNVATESYNYFDAIMRRIKSLVAARDLVGDAVNVDWNDKLLALEKELINTEEEIRQIIQTSNKEATNEDLKNFEIWLNNTKKTDFTKRRSSGNIENLGNRINELIYQAKRAINSSLTGELAEYFVTVALQTGKENIEEIIDDLINNNLSFEDLGWTGKVKTVAVKKRSNFIVQGAGRKFEDQFFKFDTLKGQISPKQDKVDLTVTLENQPINISLKNYNLVTAKNIHLLSGADLTYYLQTYGEFLNHYLNIAVYPVNALSSLGNADRTPRSSEVVYRANQIMVLTLALKALAGGVLKLINDQPKEATRANVFIVHDNTKSQGGFAVYFIDDIMNFLIKQWQKIENYVDLDNFYMKKRWPMHWGGAQNEYSYSGAYSRIVKLLTDLSHFKISLGIQQSVLSGPLNI